MFLKYSKRSKQFCVNGEESIFNSKVILVRAKRVLKSMWVERGRRTGEKTKMEKVDLAFTMAYTSGMNNVVPEFPKNPSPFAIRGRIRSFKYAFAGLWTMLKTQHNAWIHAMATAAIAVLGAFFGLSDWEWCCLVLAVMAVWTAEALNTALELLADVASPEFHPLVKQAKDVAAGAVLIAAIGSAVIGGLVLGPYVLRFLREALF